MRKASLTSFLSLIFAAPKRAESSSLLPILYQTRTLLTERKTAGRFHAANTHVHNHDRRMRNFCYTSQGQAYADRTRRPNSDPITFVDPYHDQSSDALSHVKPQKEKENFRPSTVTASEQAAFNRLINDFSQPMNSEPDGEDILDQDELISGYDPNADLDSIFENAIKQLRLQEEQAAKAAARNLLFGPVPRERAIDMRAPDREQALNARTFKRPLKLANGITLSNDVETDEERVRLEVACDDHRTLVMGMLDGASSDMEIWQVLEKEVFSLITHLDDHIKILDREKKLHAAKARKAEAEGKKIEDVKPEKRDLNKKEISTVKLTRTKAIPVNNLLSILHRNYAEYCLHALRLFRRRHPTSLYAPHVLSTIKRRGPISYVLGVSTDVYNEILFFQWTQYSDLQGMADTLEEMLHQGIEGNEVTIALIKGIAKQRRMGRRSFSGPVVREWWDMRGTKDGWRRVLDAFSRITSELAKRKAMLGDEAESENGELETDKE